MILKIIYILLILYLIAIGGVYLFQRQINYLPNQLRHDYHFAFDQPFEEFFIEASDGATINVLFFPQTAGRKQSRGLILYFHGNADNLQRWGQYAIDMTRLGYDVAMMEFRSFGKSTGYLTEEALYDDAYVFYQWAIKKFPHDKLIVYGRSLGSAIASNLCTKITPDLLILETPFNSFRGAISRALRPLVFPFPFQTKYSNEEFIPHIKAPIVIFQGTRDRITPISSARKLKPLLKRGDRFFVIPKAGHKNLRAFDLFHRYLAEVLVE